MKKYFFKNDAGQQGPFNLEELKDKGLNADTPVWHEGLDSWTTAGQVEELKEVMAVPSVEDSVTVAETKVEETMPEAVPVPVAEIKPEEPAPAVETVIATAVAEAPVAQSSPAAAAPVATAAAPAVKAARKKGNPVVTWVLGLAVLGGTGYYVYQDMEKNKTASPDITTNMVATDDNNANTEKSDATTTTDNTTPATPDANTGDTTAVTTTATTTEPAVTTTTVTDDPAAAKKAEEEKKKIAALTLAKKKEEEKKKLAAAADAKKKEEEKKKLLAAQALAAKEMEMRNKWARYVTIGSYKIEGDDKVKPFTIPVNNGLSSNLDKVTLRVDYLKKEKIVFTETLTISNIPARGSGVAQATGNRKGHTANVYIASASSSALQFCYPSSGGKAGDPYYCN